MADPITSVNLNQDATCTLISVLDSTVKLLDANDGTLLQTFKGLSHQEYRLNSTFDWDEGKVISGSEDGTVRIWDLVDGSAIEVLMAHKKVVTRVVSHPKKGRIFTASVDGEIKGWTE